MPIYKRTVFNVFFTSFFIYFANITFIFEIIFKTIIFFFNE